MKDIYELFNDIEIDANDLEEIEVNEWEKAQLKRSLKKSIKQKKKGITWKKTATAAAIISLSVITFGLTFPAYAVNIPVVGDIFLFLNGEKTGLYDQYKKHSTEVNMSKESHGVKVTVNDAIFDGKTIAITYTIESEHDLGDAPSVHPYAEEEPFVTPFLVIKGEQGWSGSSELSKVDKYHYVGITTASRNKFVEKDAVNIELLIPIITTKGNQKLKGDWNFKLKLKATENNLQVINKSSEKNGVRVEVDKMTVTPMSFILYFNQMISDNARSKWPFVEVDLRVKDDLGNVYSGEVTGGWSDDEKRVSHGMSKTFGKLDPNATKLIVTPQLRFYKDLTRDGSYIGEETFLLKDIIVGLKNESGS